MQARSIIWSSKLHQKKYVETTWIFRPLKLHRKKYVETTPIIQPSNSHRKKYMEQRGFFDHRNYLEKSTWTWIFRSAKLHQRSTWKRRGNLSKFGLRRIHVISTSNRLRCELGIYIWHRVPVGYLYLITFNTVAVKIPFNASTSMTPISSS